jgi:2-polyprenyl-6-methoxyphenol hydroxylase-like FAD-dependent oxidoreductase
MAQPSKVNDRLAALLCGGCCSMALKTGLHSTAPFERFEDAPANQVTANLADVTMDTGDLLVGADGASSRVARQLLPQATRVDTGIVVIAGRFALDTEARVTTPPAILGGPTLILAPQGRFLFAIAIEYPPQAITPHDRDEYVMWGLSARREDLGLEDSAERLDAETARAIALENMKHWNPALRRMVERADPTHINAFSVKSASPISPWVSRNVTLLGDALPIT